MSTWYMTDRHRDTITPVEVTKSTSNRVWYLVDSWGDGKFKEQCSNKRSDWHQFHETFEQAKQFLIDRETGKCEWHKAQAHRHQSALGSIKKLRIDGTQTDEPSALEASANNEVVNK